MEIRRLAVLANSPISNLSISTLPLSRYNLCSDSVAFVWNSGSARSGRRLCLLIVAPVGQRRGQQHNLMKHALDGSGELMEAREGAASRGRCPYCGAPVILRHRAQAGGKGGVAGTIAGVLIFAILDTMFNQIGMDAFLKQFLRGAIIILAVASYTYRYKGEVA